MRDRHKSEKFIRGSARKKNERGAGERLGMLSRCPTDPKAGGKERRKNGGNRLRPQSSSKGRSADHLGIFKSQPPTGGIPCPPGAH